MKFNPTYSFVLARMMEDTFPGRPETGTSAVTALRVHRIYGAMPMEVWPERGNPWPPTLPGPEAQERAKQHRIDSYHRVVNLKAARATLAYQGFFCATVPTTPQWRTTKDGRVEAPKTWEEVSVPNLHSVCVVSCDDHARTLKFWNSWSRDREWGEGGFGYLSYDYWNNFQLDSWTSNRGGGRLPSFLPLPPPDTGMVGFAWARSIEGIGIVRGWQVCTSDTATDLAWACGIDDSKHLDIHELYVRPEYRRRGIGRYLVGHMARFAEAGGVRPRYWLSHFDNAALGLNKLDIAYSLGYRVLESSVPWAAKLLVPRTEPHVDRLASPAFRLGSCAAGAHAGIDFFTGQDFVASVLKDPHSMPLIRPTDAISGPATRQLLSK